MSAQPTNWGYISRAILDQKSILFLGPGITLNYGKAEREREFLESIVQRHPDEILSCHDDGFLVFRDQDGKEMYLHEIQPFYEKDFSNPLLELLAEIPFHLIVSVTPDLTMNRIFERKSFDYMHHYYNKIKTQPADKPEPTKPLLYNLLGCVKDIENTVITHQDLFNLIQSLYADKNLPDVLLNAFNKENSRNVLFLGFDFKKWYFQLLLHLLRIQNLRAYSTIDVGSLQPPYDTHFNIQLVQDDLEQFVRTLHAQFTPAQLRKASEQAGKRERKYLDKSIFKLLNGAFVQGELETFCMLNYEEVFDSFSPEQSRTAKLTALFDYVKRNGAQDELLALIQEENPHQYEKNAPYYEEVG